MYDFDLFNSLGRNCRILVKLLELLILLLIRTWHGRLLCFLVLYYCSDCIIANWNVFACDLESFEI
jgi:hypothetical protein